MAMAKATRSCGKITLWLIDQCIVEHMSEFKPPTVKLVYLHFRHHHLHLQQTANGSSTVRDAAKLAVNSVQQWWTHKAGIPTKTENAMIVMIEKTHKEWTKLYKQRKIDTKIQKENRKIFLQEIKKTFWAPMPNCEKQLCEEDRAFLENMKGPERVGRIAGLDQTLQQQNKRKQAKIFAKQRAVEREEHRVLQNNPITENNENEEDIVVLDNEECTAEAEPKPKKYRESITLHLNPKTWSKKVCSAADKHSVSHRGVTEIVSALIQAGNGDINEMSLSRETVRRHRNKTRTDKAASILEEQLSGMTRNGENETKGYVIHWDGKMLKPLEHAGKKQEVLAVLLTSTHDESEILLSIIQLQHGEGNAEIESQKIIAALDELEIDQSLIIGLVFDTTSLNTGIHNGVVVRLQREFDHKLLQLPCRHHVYELLCGSAARFVYGDTNSPREEVFSILVKNWQNLNKTDYVLYSPQTRCVHDQCDQVVEFCQSALVGGEAFRYRNDYKELLELTLIYLG